MLCMDFRWVRALSMASLRSPLEYMPTSAAEGLVGRACGILMSCSMQGTTTASRQLYIQV